jgi:hypothetical protein
LEQKLLVLVNTVLIHAAPCVPMGLVAQVQGVMIRVELQIENPNLQMPMGAPGTALASVGFERLDVDAQRLASLAAIAIRSVSEHAAASKALIDQLGVNLVVDQVAGRGDL